MAPSYRLGKGPIVRKLETYLADRQNFSRLLEDLVRATAELSSGSGLSRLTAFEDSLRGRDKEHLRDDVFGRRGGNERRRVYYEGMKQALELAKDLGTATKPAPIQILWGCGQPKNECWVTWSRVGGKPNITVVIFSDVAATGTDASTVKRVPRFPSPRAAAGMFVVQEADGATTTSRALPAVGV